MGTHAARGPPVWHAWSNRYSPCYSRQTLVTNKLIKLCFVPSEEIKRKTLMSESCCMYILSLYKKIFYRKKIGPIILLLLRIFFLFLNAWISCCVDTCFSRRWFRRTSACWTSWIRRRPVVRRPMFSFDLSLQFDQNRSRRASPQCDQSGMKR